MSRPLILAAFDPSSTAVGYCFSTGPARDHVLDAGVIKPNPGCTKTAEQRIRSMLIDVRKLMAEHQPGTAVIEKPSKHVHGDQKHKGAGAGLAIYGMGVGAVWATVEAALGADVTMIDPNAWTRGHRKSRRAAVIRVTHGLSAEKDTGADCADAIELSQWWWEQYAMFKDTKIVVR